MSIEYKWVKFRTRHSSGPSAWKFREMRVWNQGDTLEEELQEFIENLNEELSTHSEHWRGVEGDFEDPDLEFLEREVGYAREAVAEAEERLARLYVQFVTAQREKETS